VDQIYRRRWRTLPPEGRCRHLAYRPELTQEATLRKLQADKQAIHPRDPPPGKRRALIKEVFVIHEDISKN
jgi:hypothetical protein